MNGKYAAKRGARLAMALSLGSMLAAPAAIADFDNLNQQLAIQQHKSRFQLMLEQVQERARQRAVAANEASAARSGPSTAVDFGDWTETVRLTPVVVVPKPAALDPDSTRRLSARQAHERDQQRILEHRQNTRALIAGSRANRSIGSDRFALKRRELVRSNTQNQRLSLQRKLRR